METGIDLQVTKKYNHGGLRRYTNLARTGRPKSEEPRRNNVMVRFTDKEYQKLKACAKERNLTITETVRKGIGYILNSGQ